MIVAEYTSVFGYVLFYDKQKVYLVDTIYTDSLFNLPKPPEKVTLKAYQLKPEQVSNFKTSKNKAMENITAVLVTQPFVLLVYDMGKQLFQGFEENYYVVIKLVLLLMVLTITMISSRIYLRSQIKKIPPDLIQKSKTFYLKVDQPKELSKINLRDKIEDILRNTLGYILGSLMIGVPLYLYFKVNNGSESALLIVVSFVCFFFYLSTKVSPISAPAIKHYTFTIAASDK